MSSLSHYTAESDKPRTVGELVTALQNAGAFGLWADIYDESIDSVEVARQIRESQKRY